MMRCRRYLTLLAIVVGLIPRAAQAENAITFTNANAGPGELVTIDIIIENDVKLGALLVPFRWSTPDLQYQGLEFLEERYEGTLFTSEVDVDPIARTGGILVISIAIQGVEGWLPIDRAPIARIRFRVSPTAADQVAFIDSVFEVDTVGQTVEITTAVEFVEFEQTETINPSVVPGMITIGDPEPAELRASPAELFLQGHTDGDDALAGLSISSDRGTELTWSLDWQSLWLTASPSIGKTPATSTIGAVLFGIDAGEYHDTITVRSENAVNAPLAIPVTLIVDTALTVPDDLSFALMQNRPNPFVTYHDPQTEINYVLDKPSHVTIDIFNIAGQRIHTLVSRDHSAGSHSIIWDGHDLGGRDVPSGHYFYRMTTADGSLAKRLIVIK